jgi:hypothetical protein
MHRLMLHCSGRAGGRFLGSPRASSWGGPSSGLAPRPRPAPRPSGDAARWGRRPAPRRARTLLLPPPAPSRRPPGGARPAGRALPGPQRSPTPGPPQGAMHAAPRHFQNATLPPKQHPEPHHAVPAHLRRRAPRAGQRRPRRGAPLPPRRPCAARECYPRAAGARGARGRAVEGVSGPGAARVPRAPWRPRAAAFAAGARLTPRSAPRAGGNPQEKVLQDAIKEAEEVCDGGAAGECAAAWDNVSGGSRGGGPGRAGVAGREAPGRCTPRSVCGPDARAPAELQVEEISAAISHKKQNDVRAAGGRGGKPALLAPARAARAALRRVHTRRSPLPAPLSPLPSPRSPLSRRTPAPRRAAPRRSQRVTRPPPRAPVPQAATNANDPLEQFCGARGSPLAPARAGRGPAAVDSACPPGLQAAGTPPACRCSRRFVQPGRLCPPRPA